MFLILCIYILFFFFNLLAGHRLLALHNIAILDEQEALHWHECTPALSESLIGYFIGQEQQKKSCQREAICSCDPIVTFLLPHHSTAVSLQPWRWRLSHRPQCKHPYTTVLQHRRPKDCSLTGVLVVMGWSWVVTPHICAGVSKSPSHSFLHPSPHFYYQSRQYQFSVHRSSASGFIQINSKNH